MPFSWYEPMWLENLGFCDLGDGWKLTESGATAFDGDIPWNTSGGVLSSNPIGASGMLRFLEVAMQVRGQAGEHQVDGARLALGQAYGGGSQFFAMWVVGSDKPSDSSVPGGQLPGSSGAGRQAGRERVRRTGSRSPGRSRRRPWRPDRNRSRGGPRRGSRWSPARRCRAADRPRR